MVRVDQIPMEVRRAMRAAWARRNNSDSPEKTMADLAVAMLAAWPGAFPWTFSGPLDGTGYVLPLTQKDATDE